jgi:hypothetical protein
MAEPSLFSFYADAPEGSPQSYDALQMRRKIAAELAAQKRPYASNIGEGIASMGDSFANAMNMIALDRQSKAFAAHEADLIKGLGGLPGDSGPAPARSAPPPPPSAAPQPAAPATPAALPPIAPAPITPQGDAPMSQSAIDAGATQGEVNDARVKLASALTNQGMLSPDTIGGQPPQPLMAPPANERVVARPPVPFDAGTPPVVTNIPKAQAGYSDPALEPIAPMPKPLEVGPAPVRPPQVPLAPEQRQILDALHSPYLSDNTRKALADRYKVWEDHRLEQQRQSDADFTFAREDQNKKEEQARLEPGKLQAARIGAAQSQAATLRSRQEFAQNENAFDTVDGPNNEKLYRLKGAAPGTPFMPIPGTLDMNAVGNITPDAGQTKLIDLAGKAIIASRQAAGTNFTALAGLNDQVRGYAPLSNYLQSEEYKSQSRAASAWVNANIRKESGAAISPDELVKDYSRFFPKPGDGPQQILEKAEARRGVEELNRGTLGNAGRILDNFLDRTDQHNFRAEQAKPPVPVSGDNDPIIATLPHGRRVVGPDGKTGVNLIPPRLQPRATVPGYQ